MTEKTELRTNSPKSSIKHSVVSNKVSSSGLTTKAASKEVEFMSPKEGKFNNTTEDYAEGGRKIEEKESISDEEENADLELCQSDEEYEIYEVKHVERDESDRSSETISSVNSKLSPFHLTWAYGAKANFQIINLTKEDKCEVFYVSSHFGVIYNYRKNTMTFLPGHNNPISAIGADYSGRWLISADSGEDNVIIIWDNFKKLPVWCLYNVFPDGVGFAKISQDARFLIAINSNFDFILKFWKWTLGNEEADAILKIDPSYGPVVHLQFNLWHSEQLVVTMKLGVTFAEWEKESKTLNSSTATFDVPKKKIGFFRESIFLGDNHSTITSTSMGYLIVWTDVGYFEPVKEEIKGTIQKKYLKRVKVHKTGITCVRFCDGNIVTSAEDGSIHVHDQYLRLIYMAPNLKLDPLVCISYNKCPTDFDPFTVYNNNQDSQTIKQEAEPSNVSSVKVDGTESAYSSSNLDNYRWTVSTLKLPKRRSFGSEPKRVPSDCTIERRPIQVRDYVFSTKTGKIGYLSHQRRKVFYFFNQIDSSALAIDCSPVGKHFVVGYASGAVVLYDYVLKKALVTETFPGTSITTLKYSHFGHTLSVGTESGTLLEVDPFLLIVKNTIGLAKSEIKQICFSPCDDLIACYDQLSTIYVYSKPVVSGKIKWLPMGKYISHYKPITGILFEESTEGSKRPRLFTIGEDRMLIEYDMANMETNKLKILNSCRIEQTAIPLCFTWHPKFHNTNDLFFSNSEYKLKVLDSKTHVCKSTTLGPTADTPIQFMKVLPLDEPNSRNAKVIYGTKKHIGLKILPSTGNPFDGIGMVAHPEKIICVSISHDNKYVFTAGKDDRCVLMWEANVDSVEVSSQMGGSGLDPFASLIEGGLNSFLFKEIEDFFYYAQIIHQGEDPNMDRSVSKTLALCEIPDLFRALGYYPTDYEVNNLLYELKHLKYNETGEIATEVSFDECIKAFLNHRPAMGVNLKNINDALMAIADVSDPADIIVERTELYKALEEKAEKIEHRELMGYLCILLLPKDESNPVPAAMPLHEFSENVLGIDLSISEESVTQITHAFETRQQNT